jgi:hypothetical protein
MLPNHYKIADIGIVMISEGFLKFMVGGTAVLILVALVVLVIKLHRHQRDQDSQ